MEKVHIANNIMDESDWKKHQKIKHLSAKPLALWLQRQTLERVHSKMSKRHKATMSQMIISHSGTLGAVVGSGRHR